MAYVERHAHKVQEQVYHVLEGEGLMEIDGDRRVVRRHDVIFLPPGVAHSIENTGLGDLTFIVVTTAVEDRVEVSGAELCPLLQREHDLAPASQGS